MNDAAKRAIRTLLQLIAAGTLTTLVNDLAGGLDPAVATLLLAFWQVVVTFAHNALENTGAVPKVLKT